jgi:hypothetical protein
MEYTWVFGQKIIIFPRTNRLLLRSCHATPTLANRANDLPLRLILLQQLVRIDPFQTYPEADGQVSWVQPWGAATICRQVGWEPFQCTVDYFRQLDFRSGYAYVGGILADTSHGRSMLHRHYPIILKAIARAQVSQSSFSAGNSLLCTLRSSVVQRSPQTLAWPLTVTPHL